MSLDIYFYPGLNIEKLKEDENLSVNIIDDTYKKDEKFYIIYLKPETPIEDINNTTPDGFIMTYDLESFTDYTAIRGNMFPLLNYLYEKYDILFGFDGALNDAGYKAIEEIFHLKPINDEKIYAEPIFIEYATNEMIEYKDDYKWTNEILQKIININKNNKEVFLDMKNKYNIDNHNENMYYININYTDKFNTILNNNDDDELPF